MDFVKDDVRVLYRKYLTASLGSALVMSIYSFVDTIAVGQSEGAPAAAAMAIVTPLYGVIVFLAILCGIGGSVLMTNAKGEGNEEKGKLYASRLPCRVIYTDYRLAPEHPFPVPAEDCYCTYEWALEQAGGAPVIIAGDSAGGALALAVTLMARDRGLRMPNAELLVYPVTDRRMTTDSMQKYVDVPVFDAKLTKMMWDAYLGPSQPERIEYASPLEAASFAKFPPTYIEVAQFDALRDEGVLLCQKLKEQGIPAEYHEVKGACHGFETATKSDLLKTCVERRIAWLRSALDDADHR